MNLVQSNLTYPSVKAPAYGLLEIMGYQNLGEIFNLLDTKRYGLSVSGMGHERIDCNSISDLRFPSLQTSDSPNRVRLCIPP